MYKITLYDRNCNPICDGTAFWFVENLETFEKGWLSAQAVPDVKEIDRYYRSKHGEIVTDYYSDDPELNIVQEAESRVLAERMYTYQDKEITLYNAYRCPTTVQFDKLEIRLRVMTWNGQCFLCGQYAGLGCKQIWTEDDDVFPYGVMNFYGNPIATYRSYFHKKEKWSDRKEDFKHDKIETFVWLPIKKVEEDYQIMELTEKELSELLQDIVGEAG